VVSAGHRIDTAVVSLHDLVELQFGDEKRRTMASNEMFMSATFVQAGVVESTAARSFYRRPPGGSFECMAPGRCSDDKSRFIGLPGDKETTIDHVQKSRQQAAVWRYAASRHVKVQELSQPARNCDSATGAQRSRGPSIATLGWTLTKANPIVSHTTTSPADSVEIWLAAIAQVARYQSFGREPCRRPTDVDSSGNARFRGMQMSRRLGFITLLVLALHVAGARASDTDESVFSFSGFGTAGLVHSSEKQADFISSIQKPNGAGHTHTWSADVDSLIGGQVFARFTPKLTAVVQVIAEQNYDNTYRPHVEWANIQYQFTPAFSVRAGRTVLPTFLLSGTRKVGYTYPWVRPPLETYNLLPVSNIDGVDARYRLHTGNITNNVQVNFGSARIKLPGGGTIKADQARSLSYSAEYHAATVHLAYQTGRLTLEALNPLFDGFRQFGPEGIAIADKYDLDNKPIKVLTVGAEYDPGQWFVKTEWAHTETHSLYGSANGWYVSGGYRFGAFTPYITYAEVNADNLSDPGLDLSVVPPSLVDTAADLNAVLNSSLSTKPDKNTLSIGGRWDFARNIALKLQYDHTRIGAGSSGALSNLQPGFRLGGTVNVISATVDFVF
jgi:hypothetical protein